MNVEWQQAMWEPYGVTITPGTATVLSEVTTSSAVSAGTVEIATFGGWVEESPEPFDYISQSTPQSMIEKAGQAVGIERKEYHENLTAEPIPVYYVPELPGNIGGISLYPISTFVKKSSVDRQPYLPAHEGKHFSEQRTEGLKWYVDYGIEIFESTIYYRDFKKGRYYNPSEQRARDWAGQYTPPPPIPNWKLKEFRDFIISPLA